MKKLITYTLLLAYLFTFSSVKAFEIQRCDLLLSKTSTCANFDWIYGPYLDQYNSLKITLSDNSNYKSLKVIPWMVMSSHEHGSKPVTLTQTGANEYLVEKAYFMGGMKGEWYLKLQLLDDKNTIIDENRFPIKF
jgi:hypothetical protein